MTMKELARIDMEIFATADHIEEVAEEAAKQLSWAALKLKKLSEGNAAITQLADQFQNEIVNGYAQVMAATQEMHGPLRTVVHAAEDAFKQAVGYQVHTLSDPSVREAVWSLTGGKCTYCGCQLSKSWREDRANPESVSALYIEHVVPRSAGGPDNLANYVPSCHGCNTSKGSRHVLEFIQARLPVRLAVVPKQEGAA